jgi:hypothetical protein
VLVKDKQFLLLMDAVEDYARRWIRREVDHIKKSLKIPER